MTTRALRRLTTPMTTLPNLDGLEMRADPDLTAMTIHQRTACGPTLWADDLSSPGPTFITWTASGRIPAGCGYTYMDPSSIDSGSSWWVVRASTPGQEPGTESESALVLEFISETIEWRSLIRPLPDGFTLPRDDLRRRRHPMAGTLLSPRAVLLGQTGHQSILWTNADRTAERWTADLPSCSWAIQHSDIRSGDWPHVGPGFSPTDISHLRQALAAISQHLVTPRLYGL